MKLSIGFKIVRQYAMGLSETEKSLLINIIEKAIADEREQCAKVADNIKAAEEMPVARYVATDIAQAIRERK